MKENMEAYVKRVWNDLDASNTFSPPNKDLMPRVVSKVLRRKLALVWFGFAAPNSPVHSASLPGHVCIVCRILHIFA